MKMLCCVLVFGRIATAHVPAFQAQSQMDPRIASFEALFAYMLVCCSEPDLIDMCTLGHNPPPVESFGGMLPLQRDLYPQNESRCKLLH